MSLIPRRHVMHVLTRSTRAAIAGSALLLTLGGPALSAPPSHSHGSPASHELALRQAMRKLWEDHITWTRLVIVSTAANLPDLEPTTQRLLQNQTDIGNAIKPFYGDAAGAKLTELLRAHILGAADVLAAAKAGDAAKLDGAKKSWYANGDEIAAFLNSANPRSWPLADMQSMMREHLNL